MFTLGAAVKSSTFEFDFTIKSVSEIPKFIYPEANLIKVFGDCV